MQLLKIFSLPMSDIFFFKVMTKISPNVATAVTLFVLNFSVTCNIFVEVKF